MRHLNPLGEPLIELPETDSTNNHAMAQVQAQLAEHGTAYFTWYQTEGKGQRGKTWNATRDQNIMISVVIQPDSLVAENQFSLNMAMALGCYDFFTSYAIDNVKIKWPNDIFWKDRKAGGILIENIIQGKEWKYAVVGIGLNINQTLFPDSVKNPVSLKQITGKTYDLRSLISELCKHLEERWLQLIANPYETFANYNAHLYKLNENVTLSRHGKPVTALVRGVNFEGELLINRNEEPVAFGSVEWVIT